MSSTNATMMNVLSPVSEAALMNLRNISASLRGVAPAPHGRSEVVSRDDVLSGGRLHLACDEGAMDSLRMLGEELSTIVSSLEASLEEHFVNFFAHVKNRHEKELSLWVRSSTAVTAEQIAPHLQSSTNNNSSSSNNKNNVIINSGNANNRDITITNSDVQRDLSFFAIQSWLLIELESLVSTLEVGKAAVYIRGTDNADFLRLAAAVPRHLIAPANATLTGSEKNHTAAPREVPSASHSILTTVASTGVGASISRDPAQPTPRGEIAFQRCICMPLFAGRATDATSAVGCISVADKSGGREFTLADELRLWAFCSTASGVFQRYSSLWFVPPMITTRGSSSSLQQQPQQTRPTNFTCNIDQLHERIWSCLDSAATLPALSTSAGSATKPVNPAVAARTARRQQRQQLTMPGFGSVQSNNKTGFVANSSSNNNSSPRSGGSKVFLAPISSSNNNNINVVNNSNATTATTTTAPSSQNKIPMIRSGTVHDAARAKMRITAGSSAFIDVKNVLGGAASSSDAADLDVKSHEEVIESVAPYLRNLEGLWRKALDECARMKNECSSWRAQTEVKDARIIELEVALRHLTRQVHLMQTDVEQLRRAVPDSLAFAALGKTAGTDV